MLRTPEFWRRDGVCARALAPASWAYAAAAGARRAFARPAVAPVPVVCIGNLVAGGAGKTPVALAVGGALIGRGRAVHFLTRGHGGRARGPLRVDPEGHEAADVGDEPLLLARLAPTWVARDRPAGAAAAVAAGAEIVVMDDGHQNPSLAKSVSIVVVDGGYGFGNRRLLPAGPLRERIDLGLGRADCVVLMEPDTADVAALLPPGLACLRARLVPAPGADRLAGRPVVAFAGIARPEKLVRTLRELGCRVLALHPFADHHPYREDEVMAILDEAAAAGAAAVTTAKDAVRLPEAARGMVEVVEVEVAWADEAAFGALVAALP